MRSNFVGISASWKQNIILKYFFENVEFVYFTTRVSQKTVENFEISDIKSLNPVTQSKFWSEP